MFIMELSVQMLTSCFGGRRVGKTCEKYVAYICLAVFKRRTKSFMIFTIHRGYQQSERAFSVNLSMHFRYKINRVKKGVCSKIHSVFVMVLVGKKISVEIGVMLSRERPQRNCKYHFVHLHG